MSLGAMSRLELWTNLASKSGARLSTGGFVRDVSTMNSVRSIDPATIETLSFSVPKTSEAAGVISEGQVARLWRSDSDFDEYDIGQYTITRGEGAVLAVTARAPYMRLAECGLVSQPGVTPLDGLPVFEFGAIGTPQELVEQYLTDRDPADDLSDQLTWLGSGNYDPTTIVTLDVSYWSVLQFINAIIDQLANAKVLAERWFRRNGSTNYLVDILNTPT